MAIDVQRVLRAVVEALDEPTPGQGEKPPSKSEKPPSKSEKPRLSAGKAMLVGAGLLTAGRLVAGARGSGIVDSLQKLLTNGHADHQPEAEEDEDFDDEPEAEEDEDFDDEPEAEEDEDFDDEPEAEEDEDQERPRTRRRQKTRSRA